jgi:apolipoprotein N-acyltransferase
VLVVTTSGVSATIAPDGTVTASTSVFTPDVLVDATPLRATTTLAGRLRAVPEWALLAAGLAGVGFACVRRAGRPTRRLARSRREGRASVGEDEDG